VGTSADGEAAFIAWAVLQASVVRRIFLWTSSSRAFYANQGDGWLASRSTATVPTLVGFLFGTSGQRA